MNRRVMLIIAVTVIVATMSTAAQDRPRTDKPEPDDLTKRLLKGKAADTEDPMDRVAALMQDSETRLTLDFDPGPDTQRLQEQIVIRLDEVIAQAKKNMTRQGAGTRMRARGDARPEGRPAEQRQDRPDQTKDDTSAPGAGQGTDPQKNATGGPLAETRREWGNLPEREREEVVQGAGQNTLTKYRNLIERYYRALAESEE